MFYRLLAGKKISDKEYELVLKVWNKFEMKTIKDYHDLYLKYDILLLTDAFVKFRDNILKNYGLCCPSQYLSVPDLSWDAMLNMANMELELITNPDMYISFAKGMTGGVSHISNRYSTANNKCLKSHDSEQESKHIIYSDANNLFGYAISRFLSTNGFKWVDPKEFDLNKYISISSKGYVLKVDLEYPKKV